MLPLRLLLLLKEKLIMLKKKLVIYFKKEPENDRFFPGDHLIIPRLRELVKGRKIGGVEKVFINLCKGLKLCGVDFEVNTSFHKLKNDQYLIVLGTGKYILKGYNQPNPIVAGIGLMTHPSEWPSLTKDYPVVKYLQHCEWASNVYKPYFGDEVCDTWFAGIETEKWKPDTTIQKSVDVLIYNKIRWDKEEMGASLVDPVKESLRARGLTFEEIVYGSYKEPEYHELLKRSRSMVFLCEHESQGFACCEAMSMNVPVFAWDNGFCLDPNRIKWGAPIIPASSVPFFDATCGERFKDIEEYQDKLPLFLNKLEQDKYQPRQYILEHLTLEKSGQRMLEILEQV